jgi:hypothetical protein
MFRQSIRYFGLYSKVIDLNLQHQGFSCMLMKDPLNENEWNTMKVIGWKSAPPIGYNKEAIGFIR